MRSRSVQGREVGVLEAGAQEPGRRLEFVESAGDSREKGVEVVRSAVGEAVLAVTPDSFGGIEFRGVGGKGLEVETRVAPAESANGLAFVLAGLIPDDDHGAPQVSEEVTEEEGDIDLSNVLGLDPKVQTEATPDRAHRDGGDHRELIPPVHVAQDRGLPARGPGALDRRKQEKARFVKENQVRPQLRGVFFTRGQRYRFQRSTASSSRSTARRSGFCTLKPRRWSIRPT